MFFPRVPYKLSRFSPAKSLSLFAPHFYPLPPLLSAHGGAFKTYVPIPRTLFSPRVETPLIKPLGNFPLIVPPPFPLIMTDFSLGLNKNLCHHNPFPPFFRPLKLEN